MNNHDTAVQNNIAYCGIICRECVAYKATQNQDREELGKIAERWGQHDNTTYTFQDIECNGCSSEILNKHCYVCEIRSCGKEKQLSNCGECEQFACEKLVNEWHTWHDANWKHAKKNLEETNL